MKNLLIESIVFLSMIILLANICMAEDNKDVQINLFQEGKSNIIDKSSKEFWVLESECENIINSIDSIFRLIVYPHLIQKEKNKVCLEIVYKKPYDFSLKYYFQPNKLIRISRLLIPLSKNSEYYGMIFITNVGKRYNSAYSSKRKIDKAIEILKSMGCKF